MNLTEQAADFKAPPLQQFQPSLKAYQECYAVNVSSDMPPPILPAVCGGLTVALVLSVLYGLRRRKLLNDSIEREKKAQGSDSTELSDNRTARAVHRYANTAFYQRQLRVLESLLHGAGYALSRNVYDSSRIMPEDRDHFAYQLEDCRLRIMSPYEDADSRTRRIEQAMNDGLAQTWLRLLLEGAAENGWYVTDLRPDWRFTQRSQGVPRESEDAGAENVTAGD